MNREDEEIVIDFGRLIRVLWHRAWLIVLVMLVCGAAMFSYAFFMITPQYESSVLMYVNNKSQSEGTAITTADLSASKSLVDTYAIILRSATSLNEVAKRTGKPYPYEQLSKMISAEAVNNTEVFRVTVTSTDPSEAAELANAVADISTTTIPNVVVGSSVSIVDQAVVPDKPASPSVKKYTVLGVLLGFLLASGLIVMRELLDNKIHDEDYLIKTFDVPVLAAIPDLEAETTRGYGNY